ncbi:MAG: ATP-binding protein [Pseudomonadota bacterium]
MNRLFITTVCGFFVALAVSSAVSYWLALNPLFQADSEAMVSRLESMGDKVYGALHRIPEAQWDDALDEITGIDDYYVTWFEVVDFAAPVEDLATLSTRKQVVSYLVDGTPVLEVLINREQLVVEVVPVAGYDRRYLLNGAATVVAVLLVGLLAALLTLVPIARRLGRLQLLAQQYSVGNFAERSVDRSADSIGKLGHSMETMADQVQHLVEDNEQLVSDQQELMRAVAHEFRAPMARMRFALEMYDDAESAGENTQEISTALDELDSLVTEVLRYARLQRSAPALTTTQANLHDLVYQSVSAVQALRPDVPVQTQLPPYHLPLAVDPVQFQRALRNLISNALKYTASQVVVRVDDEDQWLWIHVDDDGPGIDHDQRKRILTPFVRLDSSRTRARGGSGLGLAIANGVMLKHAGELQITDSPEGGARFSMVLPRDDHAA